MQKILLSALLGLSFTVAPITPSRAQNPDDWGLKDCPEIENQSVIIGRSIDAVLEYRWRQILPPGATFQRCFIGDRPVVMVGPFHDRNVANQHAARVQREIIQPYYQKQIRESISVQSEQ